jgi:pyruvate formate lyase activating enzyme
VADWVCPAGTGTGYPALAHRPGPERGYLNLAVFSHVCSFDCAFCQKGVYRQLALRPTLCPAEESVDAVDERTACICFFGGDPGPQMPLFLRAARLARERNQGQILRICWETNGSFSTKLLNAALDLCLESGGCIKFDLKAFTPALHRALTGADNARTLENFARAVARSAERPQPPLVIASTLLVPGYVETQEVAKIAAFINEYDPQVPYSPLGFHPCLYMRDLPLVTASQATACQETARQAGLTRVRVGNVHLLAPG